jgi:hypothetical protein
MYPMKNNRLLIYRVTKYLNAEFKEDIYFINEVKTQLKEKSCTLR